MSELNENTLTAYLGPEFQLKLMWQLLVEPEFAEKTIPNLAIEYFDDPNLKRLFIIITEYFKEYDKVPNLQNQSIHLAINKYKTPNNLIEEETLFGVLKRVEFWNERIINKQMLHDGEIVQKATNSFIKQQEFRKLAEGIIDKVKSGAIKNKHELSSIEDKFQKITHIGEEEDDCEEVIEGIDKALRKEFRKTIPTGVEVIDALTGGGLGKGEIGVILTPSGVGKTTLLTKIANTAYEQEYNVAQVIFEDTKDQIKRKHYAIWSGIPLSKIDDDIENEKVKERVHAKVETLKGKGRLVIKRFSQEDTTIKDVKNWMLSYQKKYGFKFDELVLDYLDCLESHKKTPDRNEAELAIIKGFEALASDFDIPAWTAIQSNRSGFDAEFVEAHQSGGSIKRIQKAHFFMSVAKTPEQKEASLANIRIIKARFAQDGQTFTDCVFNNDTMEIRIEDDRYKSVKMYKGQKHHDEADINKIENTANKFHVAVSESFSKINDETINEAPTIRDVILEDMAKKFAEQNNKPLTQVTETPLIEKQTESRISDDAVNDAEIVNMHFSTNRTDLSSQEVNELVDFVTETVREAELLNFYGDDNSDNISDLNEGASEGVNEGVNEGVSEGASDGVLDWTGETFTREEVESLPEVTINDVPSVVNIPVDNRIYEIKEAVKSPSMENNRSILEVEKRLLNPDEIIFENRSVHEMLKKERKNQQVMKSS
jgi:hypothetical protein